MVGIDFFFIILILLVSVVLHELSHGYAALYLGDPTAKNADRLTLNPVKHIDMFGSIILPFLGFILGGFIIGWAKPVPFNPYNLKWGKWGEALVAFSGPLTNIIVALIFALVLQYGPQTEGFVFIVSHIILINMILAVFNLLPIPPLDGSKILFSFLPLSFVYKYRTTLESYGMILVLVAIFLIWPLLFPLIIKLFTLLTGGLVF